jgi:hypothetical protein
MKQESLVQAAIMASLEVYGDRNAVHTDVFAPYANQQGYTGNMYPGDIIGLLDGARILLLEVKELDYDVTGSPVLNQFDTLQYLQYYWLQQLGVPIQYAYAAQSEMPYFVLQRRREWPYATLNRTHVSPPDTLMDSLASIVAKQPAIDAHDSLLDWLLNPPSASSGSALAAFGLLASSAADLKASILIILTTANTLIAVPAEGMRAVLKKALKKPLPNEALQRKVEAARAAIQEQVDKHAGQQAELRAKIDARVDDLVEVKESELGRPLNDQERRAIHRQATEDVARKIVERILAERHPPQPAAVIPSGTKPTGTKPGP